METQHESEIEASPDMPACAEPAQAEAVPAEASELTALVADLEASLGDSFPQASASADQLQATDSPVIEPYDNQPRYNQPPDSQRYRVGRRQHPERRSRKRSRWHMLKWRFRLPRRLCLRWQHRRQAPQLPPLLP